MSPSVPAPWLAAGRVELRLAGVLVLAKMLGFLQVVSPGMGQDGAHFTAGSDGCLGVREVVGCEQNPFPPAQRSSP